MNIRDLRTLERKPARALEAAGEIPDGIVKVAESGICTAGRVSELAAAGYDAFLVGSALVAAADPAALIKEMKGAL